MHLAFGQAAFPERYYAYVGKARDCRRNNQYLVSGLSYDSAFQVAGGRGRAGNLYDAACSWALGGDVDQAFAELYLAVRQGHWARPEEAAKDNDLAALRADKRWEDVVERMKVNKMEQEGNFDRALQDTLNQIYTKDQTGRQAIDSIQKRWGQNSKQMDSLWEIWDRVSFACGGGEMIYQCREQTAENWAQHGHPGIAPVAVAFSRYRQ